MTFPGLDGQPAWVVIVVVVLIGTFALGVAYLGGRARHATPPHQGSHAVTLTPKNEVNAVSAIELAIETLRESAEANADRADEYRLEAKRLRTERDDALQSLKDAHERLRRCEEHAKQATRGIT